MIKVMLIVVAMVGAVTVGLLIIRPSGVKPTNPISWRTNTVQLEADNFYILAEGKVFTSKVNDLDVHSDPGNSAYTTLEAIWHQHGVEMRLNMYFTTDVKGWYMYEARSYNGDNPGEWIFYPGFAGAQIGQEYKLVGLDLPGLKKEDPKYSKPGQIHFENLRLRTTLNSAKPYPGVPGRIQLSF